METLQAKLPKLAINLQKVRKQSVSDDVEHQLRNAILSGAIAQGETLAEAQLATQLGVSRASVRQAKFQLAQEGLLKFDRRGSASVCSLSDDDAREIVEFREVLDAAAIRLACSRLTAEASADLQKHIDIQLRAPSLSQLTLLDIEFHERIVHIAGNSRLLAAWKLLRPQLELWLSGMHRLHEQIARTGDRGTTQQQTARSHREILDALCTGDADRCEKIARHHAQELRATLLPHAD